MPFLIALAVLVGLYIIWLILKDFLLKTGKVSPLLEEMKGVAHRVAYFVCSIACVYPRRSLIAPFVCNGVCPGEILINPRGNGGFGYDPLFWVDEVGKSMAELTMDEKNVISHRGRAFAQLIAKLRSIGEL